MTQAWMSGPSSCRLHDQRTERGTPVRSFADRRVRRYSRTAELAASRAAPRVRRRGRPRPRPACRAGARSPGAAQHSRFHATTPELAPARRRITRPTPPESKEPRTRRPPAQTPRLGGAVSMPHRAGRVRCRRPASEHDSSGLSQGPSPGTVRSDGGPADGSGQLLDEGRDAQHCGSQVVHRRGVTQADEAGAGEGRARDGRDPGFDEEAFGELHVV